MTDSTLHLGVLVCKKCGSVEQGVGIEDIHEGLCFNCFYEVLTGKATWPEKPPSERDRLISAVDQFAAKMKMKLLEKFDQGWEGWDHDGLGWLLDCKDKLIWHVIAYERGDAKQLVDIANFAMFLERLEGRKKGEPQ